MANVHDDPNLSLAFSEELYEAYLNDPESVPATWRKYFDRLGVDPAVPAADVAAMGRREAELAVRQNRVDQMIRNYRVRGHRIAHINPLREPSASPKELELSFYGFSDQNMDLPFSAGSLSPGDVLPLREIHRRLRATYCRSIGVQFMHIDDLDVREWLQERMEPTENRMELSGDKQLRILNRLTDAIVFEEFIQKKYIGAKSFSLEGAETLIPLLDICIDRAGRDGIESIVLGMAHRGRLNVLANILGKSPQLIFREFEDNEPDRYLGGGDVKYHLGYHHDYHTRSGPVIHLDLCFNPSHLEFVNPVALGNVRAKQDRMGDERRQRSMALLIHGDASFAGEGIIQETLNLSELAAYTTGGTLHVIVNNQIGFTTDPSQGRSTQYATDVARMLQVPLFHVNGEDPEAVAQVVNLAMEYRKTFARDVFIDMYCYRRRGHNESDEPAFTQPRLYKQIRSRKSVRQGYLEHLLKHGGVTREQADQLVADRRNDLEAHLSAARDGKNDNKLTRPSVLSRLWKDYVGGPENVVDDVDTAEPASKLSQLLETLSRVPDDFSPHPKITRLLDQRRQMARGERPLDWAAAEALALATLAVSGTRIRLSGQDSQRGTFSHRHAVLHDQQTDRIFTPLQDLAPDQAPVEIVNSPLSEAGVLGFEYGYSLASPDTLVLWEAQFGDFWNAGQVIVDQFLAAAEAKWKNLSGLVLLLPHGFEGMGPEHSSARMERFLNLTAEDNLQVVVPSTPAQFFHCLRRQIIRPWRKPLVVFTPKSMLRNPEFVSSLDDLATGSFQRILPDASTEPARERVGCVLLCSGKIYYDLIQARQELGRDDVAILRLEQLYPLSVGQLAVALAPYGHGTPVRWVQDEPANMGAWPHLHTWFGHDLMGLWPLAAVTRPESASTATGSSTAHKIEQAKLLEKAFARVET